MDIHKGRYIFPNICTLGSIFFGLYAVISTASGEPDGFLKASFAILLAALCDLIDGRVARLTRTQTRFGIELDSLADVLSFGVAPAFLIYKRGFGEVYSEIINPGLLITFMYVACGAMRLARFNVMAEKRSVASNFFTGLPIPMAACTIAALVIADHYSPSRFLWSVSSLVVAVPLLSLLMVSTIKYRSFKKTRLSLRFVLSFTLLLLTLISIGLRTNPAVALLSGCVFYVMLGPAEYLYGALAKRFSFEGKGRLLPRRNLQKKED